MPEPDPKRTENVRPAGAFIRLPVSLIDDGHLAKVSGNALTVLIVLLKFRNRQKDDPRYGLAWPGVKTIADGAGITAGSVSRRLAELQEARLIRKQNETRVGEVAFWAFPLIPLDGEDSICASANEKESDDAICASASGHVRQRTPPYAPAQRNQIEENQKDKNQKEDAPPAGQLFATGGEAAAANAERPGTAKSPDTSPPLLLLPCIPGKKKNAGREWPLTAEVVADLQDAFPNIDIIAEAKKARIYLQSHVKTYVGMRQFLLNWMNNSLRFNSFTPRNGASNGHSNGNGRGGWRNNPVSRYEEDIRPNVTVCGNEG